VEKKRKPGRPFGATGPYKGSFFHTRITQVSFENERSHIANSLLDLMGECGLTLEDVAFELNITKRKVREMIMEKDLKLSELSKLAAVLHMEYYTLFRPSKERTET